LNDETIDAYMDLITHQFPGVGHFNSYTISFYRSDGRLPSWDPTNYEWIIIPLYLDGGHFIAAVVHLTTQNITIMDSLNLGMKTITQDKLSQMDIIG